MMDLRKLDLNLLVVLDALLDERNVTRAAGRIGLSQPAASAALARLRAHLGDALLIRSRGEMFLTRQAMLLRQPIKDALRDISRALESRDNFSPDALETRFRLSMTDYVNFVLGPRLSAEVRRAAPRASIEYLPLDRSKLLDGLREETIDAAIIVSDTEQHNVVSDVLFKDELTLVVAPTHPLARKRIRKMAELARYPLVEVSFASQLMWPVFDNMVSTGRPWRATVTVPHFLMIPPILRGADFIGVMGRLPAQPFVDDGAAAILKTPVPLPALEFKLVWHRRLSDDPAHSWLRGIIREVARSVQDKGRRRR